ncbi:MAG: hypothetical protein JSV05_09550 [Candidatus Bathyarchaeota archaeon]|nr:MAG: hypothetical protein JSV05_09550 [Candidatus Bathyarchaeota archaeon]
MTETLYPYIIFLPRSRKQKVLRAIFGSRVPIDILTFSIDKGITEKIYQRDLISKLPYSNKTIIERLQALTELGILEEHMEKSTIKTRAVWLKYYLLSDFGRWFAILLLEEKSLTKNEKVGIVNTAFTSYLRWIRKLADDLGIRKEELARIFNEEIGV